MKKNMIRVGLGTLVILGIPMVLTLLNPDSHVRGGQGGGWDWNPWGLVFFVPFIFCVGLAIDFAWRKIKNPVYRVLTILLIIAALALAWVQVVTDKVSETIRILMVHPSAADYKNTTFTIEGQKVRLVDGTAAGGDVMTRYFGNNLKTDLNGDDIPDLAFLLTQERGGSGTFFYVVAAVQKPDGTYIGSDGYLLGDRIAPQNLDESQNLRQKNVIVVNYADRAPEEPMSAQPSVGKSVYLKLDSATMQWSIVEPNFEGESR
ncbi:MAG: hypothetical protein RLZZ416_94 [Candidatus Parcubacteria bacterium]|jgi:hypothetical protein